MSNQHDKYTWIRNASASQWITWRSHRGYTGAISRTGDAAYQLTITGSGAPGAASYTSLKNAKNAFRKYLRTKAVA